MEQIRKSVWRERLVVSVDDFGIRQSAQPILALARAGKIDRVAVLIGYLQSEEDQQALIASEVKIDLHLELVKLLGSGERDRDGAFGRGVNFFWRYITGRLPAARIEAEWRFQIELFRERFGRLPDGLNSHEHVHFFPPFFGVFLRLGREYGIAYLRFPVRGLLEMRRTFVGRVLGYLWRADRATHARDHSHTTDYFVSYDWIKDINAFLKRVPEGQTEILFHPERQEEYAAIEKYL